MQAKKIRFWVLFIKNIYTKRTQNRIVQLIKTSIVNFFFSVLKI